MRRARVKFNGSYHHVMNRGLEGKRIFSGDKAKYDFLYLLNEKSKKMKIRLLAYCLMDSHYHLIVQNDSGKLSEFMKQLNGHYGIIYRKRERKNGYVFQGRYKSTLIQEGPYLRMAIIYILLNPVRAGIVENPYEYKWSSIGEYFTNKKENKNMVDNSFVEEIFQSKHIFNGLFEEWAGIDIPVRRTRFGPIIGGEDFKEEAIKKYDRRTTEGDSKRMREKDYIFESAERIIEKFEKERKINIRNINPNTIEGKKLRAELLVSLKDKAGLTYKEIIEYPLFRPLKYSSLGQLYKRASQKLNKRRVT